MRLSALDLHNFRCFTDLQLRLDPATVIIGPNDAGKSTILDAVRCLLSPTDRYGAPFERRTVASMRDLDSFLAYDQGEAELMPNDPVTIVGTFADFSQEESDRLAPLAVDGALQIGICFLPYGIPGSERGRIGPRYVLPTEHPYQIPTFSRELVTPDVPWAAGFENEIVVRGRRWIPMYGPAATLPGLVTIPGPDAPPAAPDDYLGPILGEMGRVAFGRRQDDVMDHLVAEIDELTVRASHAFSSVVTKYFDSTTSVAVTSDPLIGGEGMSDAAREALVRHLLGKVDVLLLRGEPGSDERAEISGALGAGARRALALASLELYRNDDIWPPGRAVLVSIEEPEVGLHPAAARRVAASLRELPAFGVQTLVVTHSTAIVNAAAPAGLRVATGMRGTPPSTVLEPAGLNEILDLVGATPADVLLGQRFVVVEGDSDAAAFGIWARRLGIDLESRGVRFFPAGSWSLAGVTARLLELAFGNPPIHILLDGGAETTKEVSKLRRRFGHRVDVDALELPEIEMYFSASAVQKWLVSKGLPGDRAAACLAELSGAPVTKSFLNLIHHRELGGSYNVTNGARAIASFMSETEAAPLRGHLERIAGLSSPMVA